MSKVAEQLPLVVVSPVPWFPLQGLIRLCKPEFRPQPATFERQQGIDVYYPRFLSIPGLLKSWDGLFMALGSFLTLYRLRKQFQFNIIDAHFAYPDGYAATLLGKWFAVPVTITLRGTEVPQSTRPQIRTRLLQALQNATQVFSVSESLMRHVVELGADAEKIQRIGNGVDTKKFHPVDKQEARQQLELPEDAKVLISVGGLVDRKGFHRVLDVLPALVKQYPNLIYLIVGGPSPEGNISERLRQQVKDLDLVEHVRFLGSLPSDQLKTPLSAADVFVLATANEGWANVFLEAMACGLPVITTDVGGNAEVVNDEALGAIVTFGDPQALQEALSAALEKTWDKTEILKYAKANAWQQRVDKLVVEFKRLSAN
ncbi:MAG: glycosyltransferase [Methylococcaceae bacterium]|nr:glycosyltransferase [Methylococcaceae bacterium]MDP3903303.1 glycosyltransferase [Methylococcaceae bacterium]